MASQVLALKHMNRPKQQPPYFRLVPESPQKNTHDSAQADKAVSLWSFQGQDEENQ